MGSERIQVIHQKILQDSEQNENVHKPMKHSNEQNICDSSNQTSRTSSNRRDSGEQIYQEHTRKISEQKFDKNTEQTKSERISSIRCISPNSSSVLLNRTSSIDQKRSERSTRNSKEKQTNKRNSTEQKITKNNDRTSSERISRVNRLFDSEHIIATTIEPKKFSKKQRANKEQSSEQISSEHFENVIFGSDLDIDESKHLRTMEQKESSKEQYHEKYENRMF